MELEYKDDVAAPWDDHQSIPHGQNCLDRYLVGIAVKHSFQCRKPHHPIIFCLEAIT